jgi:hypothetical protein
MNAMMVIDARNPRYSFDKRIFLDDEEILGAFRAKVPVEAGVKMSGWIDSYIVDEKGRLCTNEDARVIVAPRLTGLTKWEPR